MIKKPLSGHKSTPALSSVEKKEIQENGENLPPAPETEQLDSSPEKKDEEKPVDETAEQQVRDVKKDRAQ